MLNKLTLTNPSMILDNSSLIGGVHYTHTVNAEQDVQCGQATSACISFKTKIDTVTTNSVIKYEVMFNEDTEWMEVGIFYIDTIAKNRDTYTITAYDAISKLDITVDDFITNLADRTTLNTMYTQLCTYCGITASGSLPANGSIIPTKPTAKNVTGRQLMQWIAEVAGCFVYAVPSGTDIGKIKAESYRNTAITIDNTKYVRATIADAPSPKVNYLVVQTANGIVTFTGGTGEKQSLMLYNNPLIYNLSSSSISGVLSAMYQQVAKAGVYYPCNIQMFRSFGLRAGDKFTINGLPSIVMTVEWDATGVTIHTTGNVNRQDTQTTDQALNNSMANVQRLINEQGQRITYLDGIVVFRDELANPFEEGGTIIDGSHILSQDIKVLDATTGRIIFEADSTNHSVKMGCFGIYPDSVSYMSPAGTGIYMGLANPDGLGEVKFQIKTEGGAQFLVNDEDGQGLGYLKDFQIARNDVYDNSGTLITLEAYFADLAARIYALEQGQQYYSVTLRGTNCSLSGSGTYRGGSNVTVSCTPNTGYTFDGWYVGSIKVSSSNPYTILNLTDNVTYEARVRSTTVQRKITVNSDGHCGLATSSVSIGTQYVADGSTLRLMVNPNSGYAFDYIMVNGTTVRTNPYTFVADRDYTINIYNKSLVTQYTVTAQGYGCTVTPASQPVIAGNPASVAFNDDETDIVAVTTNNTNPVFAYTCEAYTVPNILQNTAIRAYNLDYTSASYDFRDSVDEPSADLHGYFIFRSGGKVFDEIFVQEYDGVIYYANSFTRQNIVVMEGGDWVDDDYKHISLVTGRAESVMTNEFYNWFVDQLDN